MTISAPSLPRRAFTVPKPGALLWMGTLAALVGLGLYGFVVQQVDGHQVTAMADTTPWGLYIAGFVFFVGASAGSTVIGLMVHAFGRKDYEPLATRAILIGFLSLAGAVTNIAVDVGRTERMFLLPWYWHNPTSMFFYTSITYYLFALILLGELYFTVKITRRVATARDRLAAKWLAIAAVPFALAVLHAPHGALFAVIKARGFWNNPLLPPHFAVVALVSGTALVALVAVVTSWLKGRELVSRATLTHMGGLLAFFIALAGFLDFFDWLVFAYSDKAEGVQAWNILFGSNTVLSVIHVAGYVVAFAVLLFVLFRRPAWFVPALAAASALTLVAVAAYRYNLVVVGQALPLLPVIPRDHYWPSWYELAIGVGIIALIALTYSIAVRVLPLEEEAPPRPEEEAAVTGAGRLATAGGGS
jgi:molybdopterin-containing oxidoreductase family membrane subunit